MKKYHFFTCSKICTLALIGAGALFLASCAKDGFDDESFDGGVSNTQVAAVTADAISITASADGKSQTISWPVVMGAGGYRVNLIDISNPQEPIINDSIVDGCSVTAKREEDANYKLTILTLGNTKKNNTDASEAVEKLFSTFTPTFKTIPAGSNLNEWFTQNPTPKDSVGRNLNYDLEAGAEYTVSGVLDFDAQAVTLRTNDKANHAKIKYTSTESTITFTADFNVKYLDFDCAGMGSSTGVFGFSKESTVEAASTKDADQYKWDGPLFNKVVIANSNFDNVKAYFFWDSQVKTACMTLLIDNCQVHMTPEKNFSSAGVLWLNKGGFAKDVTVTNSTFYQSPDCVGDFKYFYQAGMVKAPDLYVENSSYAKAASNSVTYTNCTFYHLGYTEGEWGNYNAMKGKEYSYWTLTDCIFYDCSTKGGVPRRFLHGTQYGDKYDKCVHFNNNTYMKADGTFQDIKEDGTHDFDLSGTTIDEDPLFANPAAGDFHIGGPTQIARKTGDPRWLP